MIDKKKKTKGLSLYDYQIDAIKRLHKGAILNGSVGTGKGRVGIAFVYLNWLKGKLCINGEGEWAPPANPMPLYIITTSKKRDSLEFEEELLPFHLGSIDCSINPGGMLVVVDSWNNIKKYVEVKDAIFIFDEDKAISHTNGAWSKAFLKIARNNLWIMLSATSGDVWFDYMYVFIANGFYRNKTDFVMQHVVYKPYMKFPVVDHYINTGILLKHRAEVLVNMKSPYVKEKKRYFVSCCYDKELYKTIWKMRWDPYNNCPIEETGKLFALLRRSVNCDESRFESLQKILKIHPKIILFYNFTAELDLLREHLKSWNYPFSEWNGQKHEEILQGDKWVYVCQYTASAEGWNCITTDTIVFFSLNYSYKIMKQSEGRIDRINSPFETLYYYRMSSYAPIDLAIKQALQRKKKFNESVFLYEHTKEKAA